MTHPTTTKGQPVTTTPTPWTQLASELLDLVIDRVYAAGGDDNDLQATLDAMRTEWDATAWIAN